MTRKCLVRKLLEADILREDGKLRGPQVIARQLLKIIQAAIKDNTGNVSKGESVKLGSSPR